MEIQKLKPGNIADFNALLEIFKEVFEHEHKIPHTEQLEKLLANPDFIVFVVKVNGKVAGGLTIYVLHSYYGVRPVAYIYDVGIAPLYQRQGLGKALIEAVCMFCKENAFEEAYVEAEADDIDAVSFYRKTNFTDEMQARHFTYGFF